MQEPKERTTREKLIEYYRGCFFYYVDGQCKGGNYKVIPCVLNENTLWKIDRPFVNMVDVHTLKRIPHPKAVSWSEIYDSYVEAKKRCDHCNKLYDKGFYKPPYVALEVLEEHKGDLIKIQSKIREGLKKYHDFQGIEFTDVSAGGIQIRGFHRKVKNASFGGQPTIKYDFSNKDEATKAFIEMWKSSDTPKNVKSFNSFLKDGAKYGWD